MKQGEGNKAWLSETGGGKRGGKKSDNARAEG